MPGRGWVPAGDQQLEVLEGESGAWERSCSVPGVLRGEGAGREWAWRGARPRNSPWRGRAVRGGESGERRESRAGGGCGRVRCVGQGLRGVARVLQVGWGRRTAGTRRKVSESGRRGGGVEEESRGGAGSRAAVMDRLDRGAVAVRKGSPRTSPWPGEPQDLTIAEVLVLFCSC